MRGFGQYDPTWAMNCIAGGGIPDNQLGCVPAAIYPSIRQCVDQGGTYEPYTQMCMPKLPSGIPAAQGGLAETVARMACAAMSGKWQQASSSCQTPDQTYGINDMQSTSLPPVNCPPETPIPTPQGCMAWPATPNLPGGVPNLPGGVPNLPGMPGVPGGQPPQPPAPGTQPPQPPAQPSQPPTGPAAPAGPDSAKTEIPEWAIPVGATLAGVAVLALILKS